MQIDEHKIHGSIYGKTVKIDTYEVPEDKN